MCLPGRTVARIAIFLALLTLGVTNGGAADSLSRNTYFPHLGDLMNTMQARHLKLWLAGESNNWPLAAYEIDLMTENFRDIAVLYPHVPVADVEMLIGPIKEISESIKAKDAEKFSRTFAELTAACNSCHQAIGREYIVIQIPTDSPFSNQTFPVLK